MILGITASHGLGARSGDFQLIETVLISTNTASVTFSNLNNYSADFKHLQIRSTVRTSYANASDFIKLTFNADTTGYSRHGLLGNGSSVSSYSGTDIIATADIPGATAGSNRFGAVIFDILDAYSTSKNTTVRNISGQNSDSNVIGLLSGLWIDTSAVTSIKLESGNGQSFVSGSRFSLYGIKG